MSNAASSPAPTASATLYVTGAFGDRITPLSPSLFRHGEDLIAVRHTNGQGALPPHRRMFYVIDDDWRAGLWDRALPMLYRLKLAVTEARSAPVLEARADVIVTSSDVLAGTLRTRFPKKPVHVLQPAWPKAAGPVAGARPRRVALLQGLSHRRDARVLWPGLRQVLDTQKDLEITISGNLHPPRDVAGHAQVEMLPAFSWPAYQDWRQNRQFDLMLAPAAEGLFNRARSVNKLLEADQFGAALLCSSDWPAGQDAIAAGRALAVAHEPQAWARAISDMLRVPGRAEAMATANRLAIRQGATLTRQWENWQEILRA